MLATGTNTEDEPQRTNAPFRGSALPKTTQTLSSSPGTETDGTLQSLSHHRDTAHCPRVHPQGQDRTPGYLSLPSLENPTNAHILQFPSLAI